MSIRWIDRWLVELSFRPVDGPVGWLAGMCGGSIYVLVLFREAFSRVCFLGLEQSHVRVCFHGAFLRDPSSLVERTFFDFAAEGES